MTWKWTSLALHHILSKILLYIPAGMHVIGGIVVLLDLWFTGRGFKSWPGTIAYWHWASYLHLCASVTKQYILVPAKEWLRSAAEKANVGLAMCHRFSSISTYKLMAKGRKMSTLPILLQRDMVQFTLRYAHDTLGNAGVSRIWPLSRNWTEVEMGQHQNCTDCMSMKYFGVAFVCRL